MYFFEGDNISKIFIQIIEKLKLEGEEINKDGNKIKELRPGVIRIKDPNRGVLFVRNRSYNPAFQVAETIWNLCGESDYWLTYYNEKYRKYFTNKKLLSAYGYRLLHWKNNTNQIEKIIKLLKENPVSQHANAIIFDPDYDLDNPKFVPCITMLKFRIRNNRLYMSSFLRAQDIWLGYPYDMFFLLTVFKLVAKLLNIEQGDYYHYCDVLRLYEIDYEAANDVQFVETDRDCNISLEFNPGHSFSKIKEYRDLIVNLPDNFLEKINREQEFWKNCLKSCYAYHLIKLERYDFANDVINSITNIYKEQFYQWAAKYKIEFLKCL